MFTSLPSQSMNEDHNLIFNQLSHATFKALGITVAESFCVGVRGSEEARGTCPRPLTYCWPWPHQTILAPTSKSREKFSMHDCVFVLGVLNVVSNLLLKWGNHDGYSCIIGHCTSWYKREVILVSRAWSPGKNTNVVLEVKYSSAFCEYPRDQNSSRSTHGTLFAHVNKTKQNHEYTKL